MREDDDKTGCASTPDAPQGPADIGHDDTAVGASKRGAVHSALALTARGSSDSSGELLCGDLVGRYVVLSRLGKGGMGIVYAAYDPKLDRKVALKLLLVHSKEGSDAQQRLVREAKALAQLAHPNVVAVHDVGAFGDSIYVAMEFVDGHTLTSWVTDKPRRWKEILAVFLLAGDGLQAAHLAGLIHRDFKPDNVMIGVDSRVRVMDFGLARAERDAPKDLPGRLPDLRDDAILSAPLTRIGAMMGTPRYMAPEQWESATTGTGTDQFSYCVSLWEALYGVLPFAGETWTELALSVTSGKIQAPPSGTNIPRWLHNALLKGLRVDPAQRWSSMAELLDALGRGQARMRTKQALSGLAAAAVLAVGVVGWRHYEQGQRIIACAANGAEINTLWNEEARAALREALLGTGVSYAATTFEKAVPWIDRWTSEWSNVRNQVCLEATVEHSRSADLYDRSETCLEQRRNGFEELLRVLGSGDVNTVQRTVPAVAGLVGLDSCTDPLTLERLPVLPVDSFARTRIAELHRSMMRVQALDLSGQYAEGFTSSQDLLRSAEKLDYAPFTAEARAMVGILATNDANLDFAEKTLAQAFRDAGTAGSYDVVATVAVDLVRAVGVLKAKHAEGLIWAQIAELLVQRLGWQDELVGARLLNHVANIHLSLDAYDQARDLHRRALTIRKSILGPSHPEVADSLSNLANAFWVKGDFDEALRLHEQARAIREESLGPEHPDVASSLSNLANVYWVKGEYEKELSYHRRALDIRERTLGPFHPEVADSLTNLGHNRASSGAFDEALALHERAVSIYKAAKGTDHPSVATALINLADVHESLHAHEKAEPLYARALTIREQALGPDHSQVGAALASLANVYRNRGAHDEAIALYQRALEIEEKARGSDHPDLAVTLSNLADVHRQRGAFKEALALYERALAIREKAWGPVHAGVAASLSNIAGIYVAQGSLNTAQTLYERELAILETVQGPNHRSLGPALLGLGKLALAEGRVKDALPLLERAVRLWTAGTLSTDLAEAQFTLARALYDARSDSGGDRTRAVQLATEAAAQYEQLGTSSEQRIEVESWLHARR